MGDIRNYKLQFDRASVPAELLNKKQWVCWDEKKVPINPATNGNANSSDASTWGTIDEALFCVRKNKRLGVGFVFSADDDYIGIDLDSCVVNNIVSKAAQQYIDLFTNSYIEYSPSGTGIHIITKGKLPGSRRRKAGIEIYDKSRYFTVSSKAISTPAKIQSGQNAIEGIFKVEMTEPTKPMDTTTHTIMNGTRVMEIIARSAQSGKFDQLMSGNTMGYNSGSEADLALCSIIAFYTRDPGIIFEIVSKSGLMDDKWRRDDYKTNTIDKALSLVTETYSPPKPKPVEEQPETLTDRIRNWAMSVNGSFTTRNVFEELNIPKDKQQHLRTILSRLCASGVIKREAGVGIYRTISQSIKKMKFKPKENINILPIIMPLGLHKVVDILPGNVIMVAGVPDAGKTSFLLNIARDNCDRFYVRYYNSEMGEDEFSLRWHKYGITEKEFNKFDSYEVSSNFADAMGIDMDYQKIQGRAGIIHIVDFLEINDEFWKIGLPINEIFEKLKMERNSIAFIAIQKKAGDELGRGGIGTIQKPRLAIALDRGIVRITKGKNRSDDRVNPNTLAPVEFKLVQGCKFIATTDDFFVQAEKRIAEAKQWF